MEMQDRRAGFGRRDRLRRDLVGRHRQIGLIVGVCTEPVTAQVMTTFLLRHAFAPQRLTGRPNSPRQRFERIAEAPPRSRRSPPASR